MTEITPDQVPRGFSPPAASPLREVLTGYTVRTLDAAEARVLARRPGSVAAARWLLTVALPLVGVVGAAGFLRFWDLAKVGYNSDEAVYAGTAAAMAGDPTMRSMFPIFRAHPLLFQTMLSLGLRGHVGDWSGRALSATVGVATVVAAYLLGKRLYGHLAGIIGALLLAVMPYHVVVSRQVLLDGLMTLCATVVLYCIVRYAEGGALSWLLAAGGMMGATILAKETSVVLLGGLYAFFALTPAVRIRMRHLVAAAIAMVVVAAAFPMVVSASGRASTGQNYLLWQMFRRSNHEILFYVKAVPVAIGLTTLAVAGVGLVWLRRENSWRESLLVCWMAVPVLFFTAWPVKGYQYLLPIAPPLAVLAGRTLARLTGVLVLMPRRWLRPITVTVLTAATAASLAVPAWSLVNASTDGTFLAGTGGLPGAREAGEWVGQNVPRDAQLLTIGPSTANVIEFYGKRRAYGLSVSPNPRDRNPSYVPVPNPDRSLRDGEMQYIVWDTYTANRARFFADKIRKLIDRYHGVAVFTSTVEVRTESGHAAPNPVIIIYKVRAT